MIYICFLLLFVFAAFLDISHSKNMLVFKNVTLFYLLSIVICFIGLRYYTGADWSGYMRYYAKVNFDDKTYGIGYKSLNILSRSIVDNYYFFQFITTALFGYSAFRFCKKFSKYVFLSLFLIIAFYFSSLFMAQIRQSLAIAILLFGTPYLVENKVLKYIFCIGIACLFHTTAIFAAVCIILRIRLPKILQIIFVLLGFILIRFQNLPIQFLSFLSKFIIAPYGNIIIAYLNSTHFGGNMQLGSGLFFYAKQLLALFIIVCYAPKTSFDYLAINSLILSCIIHDAAISFLMFERLEAYVGFYAIIGWTHLFDIALLKSNKNIFFAALFLFLLFFFFPFYKERTRSSISKVSGRLAQYSYIPYYNALIHPANAYRKDWNE